MIKKIIKFFCFLLFVLFAISLIVVGFYLEKISKPSYIYKSFFDSVGANVENIFKINKKYFYNDNFSLEGNINFDLSSDFYYQKSISDLEYKKKYNLINNLSNMDINYNIKQDINNKKLLLYFEGKRPNNNLSLKHYISDATCYYLIPDVLNNYVNYGNNSYFESFNKENTILDNSKYLYNYFLESLSNRLEEKSSIDKVNVKVFNKDVNVNRISVELNNKEFIDIYNSILKDLKNDEKSSKILSGINSNFFNNKLDEKDIILNKDEKYIINIYCSMLLNKPLKFEIIYTNNDTKKVFSVDLGNNSFDFYYLLNDEVRYSGVFKTSLDKINVSVLDRLGESVGNIDIENSNDEITSLLTLNLEKSIYEVNLSSKYSDYSKDSYKYAMDLAFKVTDNNVIKFSGNINLVSNVFSNVSIEEDVSKSVLKSTLSDDVLEKFDKVYYNMKERLENE